MAKPTIVTRASKGSALTWTEGDTNLTNLRDATLTVSDGTNSKALNLNDTLTFTAGTNISISVNATTGAVTITNTSSSSGTVTSVSGTGSVNGITLTGTVTSSGSLTLGGTLGSIANSQLTNSSITFGATATSLGGTVSALNSVSIGASTASTGAFTTLSASSTVSGTGFSTYLASPPAIGGTAAAAGTFTALTSTGAMTFKQPVEAIYDNGNSGAATITPNAANGSVQKYTLTGNITWNAFGTPVAGQSITMILVQDGTGSRTLTSTGIKWSGASKTLSTAASSIDIATVYYDGTNYYGSLAKGFA